jgi:hypothetical protein
MGSIIQVTMELQENYFNEKKEKARQVFSRHSTIYNPYFKREIILNSDGFHHLQFSGRQERNKREQIFKFDLLPLALEIIKRSGTIQEYRRMLRPIGKRSLRNEAVPMKYVEYWGMVAIIGDRNIKTILRRIGDGDIIFWSVMPYSKIKNGKQKLFYGNIENE